MKQPILTTRTAVAGAVAGAVAAGVLTLGMAGGAGAATPTPKAGAHFNCARATTALNRIDKAEARIAAGLPKLHTAASKAQQAGKATRADHLKKRIARYESPAFKARLAKRAAAIEAKCHVTAPSTTSGLHTGTVSQV
jgi:hypothetical protein